MSNHPPYIYASGLISRVFARIAEAQKPDRFTQDYLATVLKAPGGSAKPLIPLLKRLSFLSGDGAPTQIYSRFRNPSERPSAMLEALKHGYATIFARNEFAHHLEKNKLRDIVVEVTGLEAENQVVRAIVGTFVALIAAGGVTASTVVGGATAATPRADLDGISLSQAKSSNGTDENADSQSGRDKYDKRLSLTYTINLNLPATSDVEVFNAIFRALKEHLLEQ